MRVYARIEYEAFLDLDPPIDEDAVRHAMERQAKKDIEGVTESVAWEVLE